VTTPLDILPASSIEAIAALCQRTMARPPTADELRGGLFAPEEEAIVRGDPSVGIVVAVRNADGGSIRLLAVDPARQREGHATRLLRAAEADLSKDRQDKTVVTIGADPPYYLFAGVETTQLPMLCLLERLHYSRHEANFNMDVDLTDLPSAIEGPVIASPHDHDEVDAFMAAQWPNWRLEVLRALHKGTLVIERDAAGLSGFCAWNVTRRGLLGPVAVRLDLLGKGAGVGLLVSGLRHMHAAGYRKIEVSWVGPIVPYAKVGGMVGRVFFVYRKTINPPRS